MVYDIIFFVSSTFQVDGMVAEFTDINRDMEKTGTFSMTRKKLFQLVGKANSNLADVILKLGLLERYVNFLVMVKDYSTETKICNLVDSILFKL